MADFFPAYQWMSPHEWNAAKNYTNDPADPGGATMFGITQHTLTSFNEANPLMMLPGRVQDLHDDDAQTVYQTRFWIWGVVQSQALASKLFDIGVNLGPATATSYLQQSLAALGAQLAVDGRLGPVTLDITNAAGPKDVLTKLCLYQKQHYENFIAADPRREKYRAGLLGRAAAVPPEV